MFRRLFFVGFLGCFLGSCASQPQPFVLKHYQQVNPAGKEGTGSGSQTLSLLALSPDNKPDAKKNITDLDGRGQAALIEALASNEEKGKKILAALASPFGKTGAAGLDTSHCQFKKKLVFSLSTWGYKPADRISASKITLTLPNNWRFLGWDKTENQYEKVNHGEVSSSGKNSFGIESGVNVPVFGSVFNPVKISSTSERSISESQKLVQSYVRFSGVLTKNTIEITQNGGPLVDLSGNVSATVTLAYFGPGDQSRRLVTFKNLFEDGKTKKSNDREKVGFDFKDVCFVPKNDTENEVTAGSLTADIEKRTVVKGDDTVMEGDDVVSFESPKVAIKEPKPVLIRNQEIAFYTFRIFYNDQPLRYKIFTIEHGTPLKFPDRDSAAAFLGWLLTQTTWSDQHQPADTRAKTKTLWFWAPPATNCF